MAKQLFNVRQEPLFISDAMAGRICKRLNEVQFGSERMRGMRDILGTMNILPAYDWVGHRQKWFYPTAADIEAEEDWRFQCAD